MWHLNNIGSWDKKQKICCRSDFNHTYACHANAQKKWLIYFVRFHSLSYGKIKNIGNIYYPVIVYTTSVNDGSECSTERPRGELIVTFTFQKSTALMQSRTPVYTLLALVLSSFVPKLYSDKNQFALKRLQHFILRLGNRDNGCLRN